MAIVKDHIDTLLIQTNYLMQFSLKLSFLSFAILFIFAACGKDDDINCDLSSIEKTIVGQWVYPLTNETVEFKSNGILIDPQNSTIGGTVSESEPTQKTWTVNTNGDVEVKSTTGNASIDATIIINDFTCDEIMTTYFGFPRTMERQ